jgi:2-oxoglutarate ferredoxin oxidoreductase subunit alpha
MASLTAEAFDLADAYRMPAMLLADGALGQMMEPVDFSVFPKRELPEKTWATNGTKGQRKKNIVNSLFIDPNELENSIRARYERYAKVEENEVRCEEYMTDDADIILVAFGITARIAKSAIADMRKTGIKAGLLRPITLWPFPKKKLAELADTAKVFLSVEMSMGQMVDDVRLAVGGKRPVHFFGRTGGIIPSVEEVAEEIRKLAEA